MRFNSLKFRVCGVLGLCVAAAVGGCEEKTDGPTSLQDIRPIPEPREAPQAVQLQQPAAVHEKRWDEPPPMTIDTSKTYLATIKTNQGEIQVELFDDAAPRTVNNFVFLAKQDFYDGVIFHRVIDDFMIQGGDPTGTGMGGPGYEFEDEVEDNPHSHEPFTLSMANAGPDTNGSQFFITESAVPQLDDRHTVFGRVTKGQEVVRKIASVPTGMQNRPQQDVVIEDVTIQEQGAEQDTATRPATQPSGE